MDSGKFQSNEKEASGMNRTVKEDVDVPECEVERISGRKVCMGSIAKHRKEVNADG